MNKAWRDAWILMRIPFSVFLMPVFWLSTAVLPKANWTFSSISTVFLILHLFLYPASNGYNSLIDKDEGPVGGIEKPPKPNLQLQVLVILFDVFSILLSFYHHLIFGYFVSVYWIVSKAYSNPGIRLKQYPYLSWIVVSIFQGGWTVLMVWSGILNELPDFDQLGFTMWIWPLAATLLLAGSYPLTQIYQHKEDLNRGDKTISSVLGIKGTFVFSAFFLFSGSNLLAFGLWSYQSTLFVWIILAFSFPALLYLFSWALKAWKDPDNADFNHTMRFNQISSIGLSLGFLFIVCYNIWANYLHLHPK
jgi:1,4-dihydroxy-2-naphthoate octaprenyltransferase